MKNAAELNSVPQSATKVEKQPNSQRQVNKTVQVKKAVSSKEQVRETTPIKEEATSVNLASTVPPIPTDTTDSASSMQLFQQVVDRVDRRTGEMLATLESSSPSLNTLRDWYRATEELNKSQKHLDRISEIGSELEQGTPLTDKAVTVMQTDF